MKKAFNEAWAKVEKEQKELKESLSGLVKNNDFKGLDQALNKLHIDKGSIHPIRYVMCAYNVPYQNYTMDEMAVDEDKNTLLMQAVSNGKGKRTKENIQTILTLIEWGAHPDYKGGAGKTALELLDAEGGETNEIDKNLQTKMLDFAAKCRKSLWAKNIAIPTTFIASGVGVSFLADFIVREIGLSKAIEDMTGGEKAAMFGFRIGVLILAFAAAYAGYKIVDAITKPSKELSNPEIASLGLGNQVAV